MSKGEADKREQLKRKRAIWGDNVKYIHEEIDKYKKVKDLKITGYKKVRNYLRRMILSDARIWFRCRCKITSHIKGNINVQ